jgi:hypothetical protein
MSASGDATYLPEANYTSRRRVPPIASPAFAQERGQWRSEGQEKSRRAAELLQVVTP